MFASIVLVDHSSHSYTLRKKDYSFLFFFEKNDYNSLKKVVKDIILRVYLGDFKSVQVINKYIKI